MSEYLQKQHKERLERIAKVWEIGCNAGFSQKLGSAESLSMALEVLLQIIGSRDDGMEIIKDLEKTAHNFISRAVLRKEGVKV